MLSGETAAGKYPVEAVQTMAAIAERTEADINYFGRMRNMTPDIRLGIGGATAHAACTTATDTNDTKTDANADMIYAVETGSAGEAAAQEKGWEINSVAAQADALMEVEAGTSDAAIVDLLMATAMTGEGTSYPDLTYDAEQKLTTEEYGIGCRKGSDLAAFINNVLAETYADGSMKKVADTYKLADAMVEQAAPDANYTVPTDGDVAYIQNKGKLVVGITEFEPMDYKDASGNWIGFDADMAKLRKKNRP